MISLYHWTKKLKEWKKKNIPVHHDYFSKKEYEQA